MGTTFSRLAGASLLLLLPLCLGLTCQSTSVRGGGWIPSAGDPSKKATFAFSIDCEVDTNMVRGRGELKDLSWTNDDGDRLKIFLDVISEVGFCIDGTNSGSYVGEYHDATKNAGFFLVDFEGDEVTVDLLSGPFGGYHNSGTLGGGSINFER